MFVSVFHARVAVGFLCDCGFQVVYLAVSQLEDARQQVFLVCVIGFECVVTFGCVCVCRYAGMVVVSELVGAHVARACDHTAKPILEQS